MRPRNPHLVLGTTLAAVAALLVVSLLPPAHAGTEPPSSVATAYNTQRKLAAAPDGTLYAAVAVNASGTPIARVLERRPGGEWTTLPPPTTTGNPSDRTSLAIDSRGRLHLAWTEVTTPNRQVFYARFDGAWTTPLQLSHNPGYAGFPSIAVDGTDRVHVAWYATPDGTTYQIYYRRLDPSGWTAERALTSANRDATNPALALGPDGHVHIVWARVASRAETEVAYLRLDGDAVAEERTLSSPLVAAFNPSLVVAPDGGIHVAWSASGRIQYEEWDGAWRPVEDIASGTPAALTPSLTLDPLGRPTVFWDATDGQIYRQVRDTSWSVPNPITSGGRNFEPSTRWSQFGNPVCNPGAGIDLIWTRESGGVLSLEYRRIGVPAECPTRAVAPAWALLAVGVMIAGVAIAAFRPRRKPAEPR